MESMEVREQLIQLIDLYGALNESIKESTKVLEKRKTDIKTLMGDNKIDNIETEIFKASYSVSNNESINEDGIVSLMTSVPTWIKLAKENKLIWYKPCIDWDALENAIYKENIPKELLTELDSFKESKPVAKLLVTAKNKKRKGKKE